MPQKRVRPHANLSEKPQPHRLHTPVGLSFSRVVPGKDFCLSICEVDEVREYVDCLRQLTTLTWQQVLETAGKGKNKAGLAYTPYSDSALRRVTRPAWLSEDVRIAAVRASQTMRLFGVYIDHTFYVLWFDRDHAIVAG